MVAGRIAEWVAILGSIVGGGVWVGSIDSDVQTNSADIQALQPVATEVAVDIATLEERTKNMQGDLTEIREQQKAILEELRK